MFRPPRLSAFSRSSAVAPKAGSFSMMSRTYWQKYADPPADAQPGRRLGDHRSDRLDRRRDVLVLRDLAVIQHAAEHVELTALRGRVAVGGREILLLGDRAVGEKRVQSGELPGRTSSMRPSGALL